MTYADKLRKFADYLERHPTILARMDGRYNYPVNAVYADGWDDFQELVKDLGGFEKSGYSGNLQAQHHGRDSETDEIMYYVSVTVSGVCEAKPKIDENGEPVMKRKYVYTETDEFEQDTEWVCPQVWSS